MNDVNEDSKKLVLLTDERILRSLYKSYPLQTPRDNKLNTSFRQSLYILLLDEGD